MKELKAYDSILQNLLVLKEAARETKPGEAEAIEAIIRSLSALRHRLCDREEFLVSSFLTLATSVAN